MKRLIFSVLLLLLTSCFFTLPKANAAENPLRVPNNKVGIHILFPDELEKAAALVNSNGGDWGYVVIPIQAGDKNLVKWQEFMDKAKKLHLIPIIRLATEGDYFNTRVWRVPTPADVLDFANFLNSLSWPIKNRYVIVFNEVNRGDEWGGNADPVAYAKLLSYAATAFKNRSEDFFIISSGMDNAAATTDTSMNEYEYFTKMVQTVPGIFSQIDGMASHSYPNPAFAQPPTYLAKTSIVSFQYEKNLIQSYSSKDLPVFITETGWAQDVVGESKAASYLSTALQTVWNTDSVAVVAPFLLQAGGGPFTGFSFFNLSGQPNAVYGAMKNLVKVKGAPVVTPQSVLAANIVLGNIPSENFPAPVQSTFATQFEMGFKKVFKVLLGVK
ncbi:MAG TPA: hypothetical protein VEW42_06170 [Candidatus Eisenbacteria bacterium]|nr:hypothetical protein [Candidatus Eisenbacteria bacterium]